MSSDARSTAQLYYAGSGRRMEDDVAALALNPQAVVIFLPRLVVLMKPVCAAAPLQVWQQLGSSPHGADAWYVHLLVGDFALARQVARMLPVYPWLCFQRGMRSEALHRVAWARFVQLPS